ncbi:hypothetical protein SAMN04487936_104245 [Halobacillus dabanensis]|uniref:Uncharacterized protein n=1 Tax=Halobacillus dabanensis TaxID=240302 RepID=A0A1I3UEH6_HALDA|nr:hypothetical protein SAMN04487936_104245 [Halobacillus dabanensis]
MIFKGVFLLATGVPFPYYLGEEKNKKTSPLVVLGAGYLLIFFSEHRIVHGYSSVKHVKLNKYEIHILLLQ